VCHKHLPPSVHSFLSAGCHSESSTHSTGKRKNLGCVTQVLPRVHSTSKIFHSSSSEGWAWFHLPQMQSVLLQMTRIRQRWWYRILKVGSQKAVSCLGCAGESQTLWNENNQVACGEVYTARSWGPLPTTSHVVGPQWNRLSCPSQTFRWS
jgi:hypothetical protein